MQRTLAVAFALLALAVGAWFLLLRGDTPPPVPPAAAAPADAPEAAAAAAAAASGPAEAAGQRALRQSVVAAPGDVLDDPEIQAGLTGFKGRVVDAKKAPVADCGVRIYRGALDAILPDNLTLDSDDGAYQPQLVAGETRTAGDGTFLLRGVWPRAFYLLFAGLGTDAPTHQIISRAPSPGEIVDLGDIVLPDAGVIVGTVLDEDGEPLPGALVRAADLPGSLAAFFPVERFDPQGAVLVREPGFPAPVMEMPAWVQDVFDKLPIPSAVTGADGGFRLVGVIPGSNLLASTAKGFLSDLKPSIAVKAGQVKDVGRIKLRRGEEITGRVVDTAGKPIADAEVLAGSMLSIGVVDFAQRLGKTDAEGRFAGTGFSPGKATLAARRGKGHAWVLAEPQSILGEVTVTLPALFGVEVAVALADGKPAPQAQFKLLHGKAGEGAAEMARLGFVPPVDLRERTKALGEGRWRLEHLLAGHYTLLAGAPGHAMAFTSFEIKDADARAELKLVLPRQFAVRVLTGEDQPIRNAAIYAEARGKQVSEMPLRCGRTDADGRLVIDQLDAEELRVSADHPKWGVVHGLAKPGEELLLRMQPPGTLRGLLTDGGKPVAPGKYTVAIERRRGRGEERGPMETTPQLVTPGLDGTFVATLQPGEYRAHTIDALDKLRSPGSVFTLAQDMFLSRDLPEEVFTIVAGQVAELRLDVGEKPIDGPTARLSGTVTVDGKLAEGHIAMAYGGERRFSARIDRQGRFDFGTVPAGDLQVSVLAKAESGLFGGPGTSLWSSRVKLAEAEGRDLTIDVRTSSLGGICVKPDGKPAPGVFVQARGKAKDGGDENLWLGSPTDADGRFRFDSVAEGSWTLEVRGGGEDGGRGRLEGVVVVAGSPQTELRIELQPALVVKGRVDLSGLAASKPRWAWMSFHQAPEAGQGGFGRHVDSCSVDLDDGAFSTTDLPPGTYQVRVNVSLGEDQPSLQYRGDDLTVPPGGVNGAVLRIRPEPSGR